MKRKASILYLQENCWPVRIGEITAQGTANQISESGLRHSISHSHVINIIYQCNVENWKNSLFLFTWVSCCTDIIILRCWWLRDWSWSTCKWEETNLLSLLSFRIRCMIKIFMGGKGVVDGEGVAVKDAWGGVVGVGVIKGSFQKHLKAEGG